MKNTFHLCFQPIFRYGERSNLLLKVIAFFQMSINCTIHITIYHGRVWKWINKSTNGTVLYKSTTNLWYTMYLLYSVSVKFKESLTFSVQKESRRFCLYTWDKITRVSSFCQNNIFELLTNDSNQSSFAFMKHFSCS